MPHLLIRRHDKDLADPMPLLNRSQPEYILREHSNKAELPIPLLPEYNIVLPFLTLLVDKGNPINVEQEQDLESLLEGDELFVIALIVMDCEFIGPSSVAVDGLAFWGLEFGLFGLFFVELLFFHEGLAPSVVVLGVIAALFGQG